MNFLIKIFCFTFLWILPATMWSDEQLWPSGDHLKSFRKDIHKTDKLPDSIDINDYTSAVPHYIIINKYTPDGNIIKGNDGIFIVGELNIDNPIILYDGEQEYVTSEIIFNEHNGVFNDIVHDNKCYLHFANNLHWIQNILSKKEYIRLRSRILTDDYYTSLKYINSYGIKYIKRYYYQPDYFILLLIRGDVLKLNPYISVKTIQTIIKDESAYYKVVFPCHKLK